MPTHRFHPRRVRVGVSKLFCKKAKRAANRISRHPAGPHLMRNHFTSAPFSAANPAISASFPRRAAVLAEMGEPFPVSRASPVSPLRPPPPRGCEAVRLRGCAPVPRPPWRCVALTRVSLHRSQAHTSVSLPPTCSLFARHHTHRLPFPPGQLPLSSVR